MTGGLRALARARAVIGAGFRLHGRDPQLGLDCVGLVAVAWAIDVPTGYPLRTGPGERIRRELTRLRFVRGDVSAGSVVIVAPGPGQLHLAISTGEGVIHADAVARRVVERAGPLPWPILEAWIRED